MYNENEPNMCFDPFRPPNQLPYPAVAGQLLVTKSDFTYPARPDLLEWKKIEEVIGVYDVFISFNEERLTATLFKIVNGKTIEVGQIGNVSPENADKLNKINFVSYSIVADTENHTIKFYGVDRNGESSQIGDDVSYISFNEYNENKTFVNEWLLGNTQRIEKNEIDIANHETRLTNAEEALQNHDMRIATNEQNIATNTQNIATNTEDIEEIKQKQATDEANIEELQNGFSDLLADFTIVKNNVNDVILPIINKLREATNPNLLLAKGEDGVSLVWVNRVAIDNVKLVINNDTRTITLYQSINGSEVVVGMWDKVSIEIVDWLVDTLTPISNNLNETSQPNFVLTKLADGKSYDWQSLKDVFSITLTEYEDDTNYLVIKLITNNDNEEVIGEFLLPKLIFINDLLDRVIYLENKKQEGNVKIFENETAYEEALPQLLDGTISLIGDE